MKSPGSAPEAPSRWHQLHGEWRSFSGFGTTTSVLSAEESGAGVPVYQNEFWTAKQRAGHSLQEISYRACYKPRLPDSGP